MNLCATMLNNPLTKEITTMLNRTAIAILAAGMLVVGTAQSASVGTVTNQILLPNNTLYTPTGDATITAAWVASESDYSSDVSKCVRDIYACRGSCRVAAVYVGYKTITDAACSATVRTPYIWWVFSDSGVVENALPTLLSGTQMWEVTLDSWAADISADGRQIIGNIKRYGKNMGSGYGNVAGNFGVRWELKTCPTDWTKYGLISSAAIALADNPTCAPGDITCKGSPTRPLYMNDGLGDAYNITIDKNGNYTVVGKAANGNNFAAICLPPAPLTQSATVKITP